MWRTVIIAKGERIVLKSNWLVVYSEENESHIPIDDIYAVVMDNRAAMVSVGVLTALTNAGAHVLFCDEKHMPVSVLLPHNTHYRPLAVVQSQLGMGDDLKDALWQRIVQKKIQNQCEVLRLVSVPSARWEPIVQLAQTVQPGDPQNREAVAAKRYFSALFGPGFSRADRDVTNAALNYGYAILRSAVGKTLAAYGYNCVLGIHHIGPRNPFNLADDLMEPLRPLVDYWVDSHMEELLDELTASNRRGLVNLLNHVVRMEGKKTRVRYAIDQYVSSLTTAIQKKDAQRLKLPDILRTDPFFEDDLDG